MGLINWWKNRKKKHRSLATRIGVFPEVDGESIGDVIGEVAECAIGNIPDDERKKTIVPMPEQAPPSDWSLPIEKPKPIELPSIDSSSIHHHDSGGGHHHSSYDSGSHSSHDSGSSFDSGSSCDSSSTSSCD